MAIEARDEEMRTAGIRKVEEATQILGRPPTMAERMRQAGATDAAPTACMGYPGWAGVQLPMLMDTAYEVAVATGALANMPYELASNVGAAYGAQRYIHGMYDTAGKMLLAERPVDVRMCTNVAREMAAGSAGLAGRYQALLDALPPSR